MSASRWAGASGCVRAWRKPPSGVCNVKTTRRGPAALTVTSFHDVDDLRAFSNVPVLVSIPRIVTQTDLDRRWWRMRLAATAALVGLVMIVGLAYVAAKGNENLVLLLARVAS